MENKAFLNNKPRSFRAAGKKIGIAGNSISSLIWRKKGEQDIVPKNIFAYRAAINLSDEAIDFLLDDSNFDENNFLKMKAEFMVLTGRDKANYKYYQKKKGSKCSL